MLDLWLLAFFLLYIPNVTSDTLGYNAVIQKYEEELIWKKMTTSLLYVRSVDRPLFLMRCAGGFTCDSSDLSENGTSFTWLSGTGQTAKERFWSTYKCFKAKDLKQCPVDGGWGSWSAWSECKAGCKEEGNSTRKRLCNNPHPVHGGWACQGYDINTRICRGDCKGTHDNGVLMGAHNFVDKVHKAYPRLRPLCLSDHCMYSHVAKIIPTHLLQKYWSSLQCYKYKRACPVDGGWGPWNAWSDCQPLCGAGTHWRMRHCTKPSPANGGFPCRGPFFVEKPCFGRKCQAEDFLLGDYLSEWSSFGACSVSCGHYGIKEKRRVCLVPGKCTNQIGDKSEELVIQKPCYNGPCNSEGRWSEWSEFTECSAECGRGRKLKIRTCESLHPKDSATCIGLAINVTTCSKNCRPDLPKEQDVTIHDDGKALGNNFQSIYKAPFSKETVPDPEFKYELEPERLESYTHWTKWSDCTKFCNKGQRSRYRNCTTGDICLGEIRQVMFCNTDKCSVDGGWSDWLPWTPCSTTCGKGIRKRYRKCDKKLPEFGGTCFGIDEETTDCSNYNCKVPDIEYGAWKAWSPCSKSCGAGSRTRERSCNLKYFFNRTTSSRLATRTELCEKHKTKAEGKCGQSPCKGQTISEVDGEWAHWGSWSSCSHFCGAGIHFRDRTCTDPAPMFGGSYCPGQGSDLTPCFHGPCPDREDIGVMLNGSSWLSYSPFHKPLSYLSIHLLVNPLSPDGLLIHRYQKCQLNHCQHSVNLSLVNDKLVLKVLNQGSKLEIKYNTSLQGGHWHVLYVYLNDHYGFLRVNNGEHLYGNFHPRLKSETNYDAQMMLGSNIGTGFIGVIAEVIVNYQVLSLRRVSGWNGYGMPEEEWNTNTVSINPVTKYPKFKGDHFMKVPLHDVGTLKFSISIWPLKLDGVVFFNKGQIPGSYSYLILRKGVFRFCLNCGKVLMCENIEDVEANRWYHISALVSGNMGTARINLGRAVQLTSPGDLYHTGSHLLIGGGESYDWVLLKAITKLDHGFHGAIHEVVVNGKYFDMRKRPLVDSAGYMNTEGLSFTENIIEVHEHVSSSAVLRCDYTRYAKTERDVMVEWFHIDKKIQSNPDQKVTQKLPGNHYLGSLTLSAKHHPTGIYICMIKHDGYATNHNAYILTRHNITFVYTAADIEMELLKWFLVCTILLLVFTLGVATYVVVKKSRKNALRPMLSSLKDLEAKASKTHKSELQIPQDIGPTEQSRLQNEDGPSTVDENVDDSMKVVKEADSDECESYKLVDIEIELRSDDENKDVTDNSDINVENRLSSSSSSDENDDVNDENEPETGASDQSPDYRNSSPRKPESRLSQNLSRVSQGARRSLVEFHSACSAKDDAEEILSSEMVTPGESRYGLPMENRHHSSQWSSHASQTSAKQSQHRSPHEILDHRSRSSISSRSRFGSIPQTSFKERRPSSSGVIKSEESQYGLPMENRHQSTQISPYASRVSAGLSQHPSPPDISDHRTRSIISGNRLGSMQEISNVGRRDSVIPSPPMSLTHRSTQKMSDAALRSVTSVNHQKSSILENQLSCSLPPAGSPSPPKIPIVSSHTSPRHDVEPDKTVSANSFSIGQINSFSAPLSTSQCQPEKCIDVDEAVNPNTPEEERLTDSSQDTEGTLDVTPSDSGQTVSSDTEGQQ